MRTRLPTLILVLALVVPLTGCVDTLAGGRGEMWPHPMTQADVLSDRGLTGEGVTVAVIDTGIDLSHPQFKGMSIQWLDLVNGRKEAYDDNGHGTHVAGIVAAQGDWTTLLSGFYMRGVAPGVDLIVVKAIAADGRGKEENVARGIDTAVRYGADVVVLSLGGGTLPILGTRTEGAVNNAIDKGVFVVAAAGNAQQDGEDCRVTSPASVSRVIAVGAVDQGRRVADFSCKGKDNDGSILPGSGRSDPHKKPEVVAPGVGILSAWKDGKYVKADGTSQAAPIVGGVLALILEEHPELQRKGPGAVEKVKDALMASSLKVGPLEGKGASAHDNAYGYGVLQGEAWLRLLN